MCSNMAAIPLDPNIVDVRVISASESISTPMSSMRSQIVSGLSQPSHRRTLPTMLLYDERGLRLYDDITTKTDEYYLFGAEEQILRDHGPDIVDMMRISKDNGNAEAIVMELGAGSLRKTSHILLALSKAVKPASPALVQYYALDLERRELVRTLSAVSSSIGSRLKDKVAINGMWGTYDGGIAFVEKGGLCTIAAKISEPGTAKSSFGPPEGYLRDITRPGPIEIDRNQPPSPSSISDGLSSPLSSEQSNDLWQDDHEHMSQSSRVDISPPTSPHPSDSDRNQPPLHMLFLGSSIGNFSHSDAAGFLRSIPLRPGSGDTLLLGLDHKNHGSVVERAYNDSKGLTRAFILNGLRGAERILKGQTEEEASEEDCGQVFAKDGWEYAGKWNQGEGRHEGYYRSTRKQEIVIPPAKDRLNDPPTTVTFDEGELVNVEYSYKYSTVDAYALFDASNLRPIHRWKDTTQRYSLWLLERPPNSFPPIRTLAHVTPLSPDMKAHKARVCECPTPTAMRDLEPQASFPAVPTLAEWSRLWDLWDAITLGMIPVSMLHEKPIDLRHKCLFYLGHIPGFLDIQLSRVLQEPYTEPARFADIFERGIDPHVDDPTQCHPHSEVPSRDEDWPTLEEILSYRDRVRTRLLRAYKDFGFSPEGSMVEHFPRKVGRVLWMTYEHEAFHTETLLYMLIQRAGEVDGTLPPPGFAPPVWSILAKSEGWSKEPISSIVAIGPATVPCGHDDLEAEDDVYATTKEVKEFGWDNESPRRSLDVGKVLIEKVPILNGQYHEFWQKHRQGLQLPVSWALDGNGGIQVRTLYGPVAFDHAKHWPFMGSYDELEAYAKSKNGRLPTDGELTLFRDLFEGSEETNIGFRQWHPIPPKLAEGDIRGHNGGVWEWTSTIWDSYDGFQPSKLYPGYSSDFFDGVHRVVLGGSYATLPRLAQRRSLRNWYQHNYPYAWIGGRVVYDN